MADLNKFILPVKDTSTGVVTNQEFNLPGGGGGTTYTAGDGIDITSDVISVDEMPSADMSDVITPLPAASRPIPNRYSTTEQIVGTWIDGKPIYQKTIIFPETVTIEKGSWRDSGVSISNVDHVLNSFIILEQFNLYVPIQSCASTTLVPSGNIGLYTGKDDDLMMDILTIQYTKTTD